MIETKPPHNLIPLMLHFSSVLGPAWPIVLFTLEDRWDGSVEATGAAFQRAQADGLFHVRFLPPETDLSSSQRVSGFLTSEWLWTQLEAIDRVLLFQTDSIICARAPLRVDDFLEWDYVGAPIGANDGVGYNGGLSLRNPRLFLEVVRRPHAPFENAGGAPKPNWCNYEDQWFFHEIEMRNGRLPSPETAKKFSIESPIAYPYATPIGYHQPQFWNQEDPDGMKKIEQYCPEMSMLLQKRAYLQQERANT